MKRDAGMLLLHPRPPRPSWLLSLKGDRSHQEAGTASWTQAMHYWSPWASGLTGRRTRSPRVEHGDAVLTVLRVRGDEGRPGCGQSLNGLVNAGAPVGGRRAGISDSDLTAFTGSEIGGPYQVVQILLAVLVGSPAAAQRIFRELMAAMTDGDILAIYAKAATVD